MSEPFDLVNSAVPPGLTVVESAAGTGKTYTISHLVPRLLVEGRINHLGELAVVTFTKDAAAELSGRIRQVLEAWSRPATDDEASRLPGLAALREKFRGPGEEALLRKAIREIDSLTVCTIHSFCQRVLQWEGTLCGLPTMPELKPKAGELLERLVREVWEKSLAPDPFRCTLARLQGHSLEADLAFVQRRESLPEAGVEPHPLPLDDLENTLRQAGRRFPPSVLEECGSLRKKIVKARQGAPSDQEWEELCQSLEGAGADLDPDCASRFFAMVKKLSEAGSWVAANSNAGKALKAEFEQCAAVGAAREILALLRQWVWSWSNFCHARISPALRDQLRHDRIITYDGLIEVVWRALRGPQGDQLAQRLRTRFRAALIDESQDTDGRQMEIFRRIFLEGGEEDRLVLIGDPKQAIYSFRGADVNTYLEAKARPGAMLYHLNKTYRAPADLVAAVNAVFERRSSLLKPGLDFSPAVSGFAGDWRLVEGGSDEEGNERARLEFWLVPDEAEQAVNTGPNRNALFARATACEISRLLRGGARLERCQSENIESRAVRPGDFAVLVSDWKQALAAMEALGEVGVPALRAAGESIYLSEEAEDLRTILRTILRAGGKGQRRTARRAALVTRLLGLNLKELRGMDGEQENRVAGGFAEWFGIWERLGLGAMLARIDCDLNDWFPGHDEMVVRLAALPGGERRLTNLRHLQDLLQEAAREVGRRPGDLLRWYEEQMTAARRGEENEEAQQRLESDADKVKIVTMHAAKGLEYPLVFCPFLWPSIKPGGLVRQSRSGQPTRWVNCELTDGADLDEDLIRESLEDRLRLAYVTLTRAQVKAWVAGGALGKSSRPPASALDWLLREDGAEFSAAWCAAAAETGRGERHASGVKLLQELCAGGSGLIGLRELHPETGLDGSWGHDAGGKSAGDAPAVAQSGPARSRPSIPAPWQMTSFSSLTRESNPHGEFIEATPSLPAGGESAQMPSNPFQDAPGGTAIGTAVHDWMERWDFSGVEPGAVAAHLAGYVLPGGEENLVAPMEGMLEELREAILPGWDCVMAEACPRAGSSEWHFQLPIASALGPQDLARVFERHGQPDYAALLDQLPPARLSGFLQGFLDRLAAWQGNWGVIDWKTNKLAGGYGKESLLACAWESHYWLQAHLYLVALGRFRRQAGAGRAWLVFLRGIRRGSSDGILSIEPTPGLLTGLDQLFFHPVGRNKL